VIPFILRLLKARNCNLAKKAVLHKTANIHNYEGNAESIRIAAFSHIRGELLTFRHGGKIEIGEYCYVGEQSKIWSAKHISIGDRVLISHNVSIFDSLTHPMNHRLRHAQCKEIITSGHPKAIDLAEKAIVIANDVWIGCMSVILSVSIGEGAIVGAGSVVTKDVPPWTVVAGNPAIIIREILPEERL